MKISSDFHIATIAIINYICTRTNGKYVLGILFQVDTTKHDNIFLLCVDCWHPFCVRTASDNGKNLLKTNL